MLQYRNGKEHLVPDAFPRTVSIIIDSSLANYQNPVSLPKEKDK